ncbi:MAG: hypothetical protein ABI569_16515 [Casimicrobiaceae bacterium]
MNDRVGATVNPGDDDDDDEEEDKKDKGGGNIDPDDDEGYDDEDDDDDDEEPLQVTSKSPAARPVMLRRTIPVFRSACLRGILRCITGPVRVLSQRRHTARSY